MSFKIKTKLKSFLKKIKRDMIGIDGNYYYGATAQDYEALRAKNEWWHAEHQALEEVLKHIPIGLSILDVPFGTGRFLPLYAKHQMKVTGLDISYAMLSTAKGLREDLVKQCRLDIGDARKLPYENDFFDIVLSFRFLDGTISFKDQKKVLSEFVRVSRKYLILEAFSVLEADDSEFVIGALKENHPVDGRLSEFERTRLFEKFGMKVIKKFPAGVEAGKRSTVYLCEKTKEGIDRC